FTDMILVTGASGVLGQALIEASSNNDEPYKALSSKDVDLRDRTKTMELVSSIKPRTIFHLAAKVHGSGGNSAFQGEMFTDNARININVIDAALEAGCEKFIGISTVAIYSSDAPKPTCETSIWNGAPHNSERAYGQAKRAMSAQLEAYEAQYGMAFAYPIMTNIYGPHDRFDPVYGHVVPSSVAKFHEAARSGTHVDVWGTGRAERDFIFADDAAAASLCIARSGFGPINVATGATIPIRRVVEILSDHSGVRDVRWDSSKPDGQLERSYD
ncbi:hypothetical protein OY671_008118, partial [Metschnikowia pulcherrima]